MSIATQDRSIPRRIAAARKLAEMTQGQLARRLTELTDDQWSREMVANLETGRRVIPAQLLASLAVALDVEPGWFFSDPRRPLRLSELFRVIEKSRWRREPPGGHPPPIDPPPHHR